MELKEGQNYFFDDEFDSVGVVTDRKGRRIEVGVKKGGLLLKIVIRGSRPPYPIQAYEKTLPVRVIGAIAVSLSHIGTFEITCPIEGGGLKDWWDWLEDIPDPSGDEPPPAKCPNPYPGNPLRVACMSLLGGLAMRETPEWPDARLPEYYDALVRGRINAERYCSTCSNNDPWDPIKYWQFDDPEYLTVVKKRLDLMRAREFTAIVCLTPYGMAIDDNRARWLIRALKDYPIVWECVNEPTQNAQVAPTTRGLTRTALLEAVANQRLWLERTLEAKRTAPGWGFHQRALAAAGTPADINKLYNEVLMATQTDLVSILKAEGVKNKFIQIQLVDSGSFYDLLHDTLNGEGLATYHWTGTMETVNAPWPAGWSTSDGMMRMMELGLYGSNDGQDTMRAARGLNFWLHDHQNPPITEYRRPDNEQIGQVAAWMQAHGKGHVEHLSAAAYQRSASPNMDDAISIGRAERQAMKIE